MKKTKRILFCLTLVIIMITTVAVPAMAVSKGNDKWIDGSGNVYAYQYSVTRKETTGVAYMYSTTATTVKAKAENTLYYDLTGTTGTVYKTATGYSSVTATAGNIFEVNDVPVRADIKHTEGTFWINNNQVRTDVID